MTSTEIYKFKIGLFGILSVIAVKAAINRLNTVKKTESFRGIIKVVAYF